METTPTTKSIQERPLTDAQVAELMADDMLPEYEIDHSKVRPNRSARRVNAPEMVRLDADVAAVFSTAEAVNTALRALIQISPQPTHRETYLP